ncbi:MAG: hypothetical protein UT84_C0015G0013 [Candidatus Curtissbacteria bacterium GW2011_GWA1_40_16]|uniref:Uncharacterized protein n=1 Tax=Candidatus Curtissbacteria bacterium GW2011_GWA1_40_16 TaxID=1618405 RepID=A0A0G0TSN5_9BACT|nr:MAG: hypothetical protein UT84_C0015G0013 [Candidatus Curtissbacteria bacterium GW2011_GWA1_40_16]
MAILFILYFLIEVTNIFYTGSFGIKYPEKQPILYRKIRFWLRLLKYSSATISSIVLTLDNLFIPAIFIFLLPHVIEKFLYWFCKNRAIKEGVSLLIDKDNLKEGEKAMSRKDANKAAVGIIDDQIKYGERLF